MFSIKFSVFLQVVERRKQIEIEDQEIKRKEKELIATIKLPAEAEGYKVQTIAEGNRFGLNSQNSFKEHSRKNHKNTFFSLLKGIFHQFQNTHNTEFRITSKSFLPQKCS